MQEIKPPTLPKTPFVKMVEFIALAEHKGFHLNTIHQAISWKLEPEMKGKNEKQVYDFLSDACKRLNKMEV